MVELPGYLTVEEIGGGEEVTIYRMLRLEDNRNVIAKTTRNEYPKPADIAAFRYEYNILKSLGGRGAVEPYSLEVVADRPILLAQDIGGSTLECMMRTQEGLGLPVLLGVASAIADCLVHVHREQITHNEITPLHLLVNPVTFEAKFIDFRNCSTGRNKSLHAMRTSRPDSVLPYISPEQTGRTELPPDYRSDFYSLGVTLYEWFTGSLPFKHQDALDIVYRHLASTPIPVHIKNPVIPRVVSDIISKCMEKMPDARYASAYGIKADLETCSALHRERGTIEAFALAGRDIPERWLFSANLYGRHSEQQCLLQALRRSIEGDVEAVWVCGAGGIGKTSLVLETLRQAVPAGAFFATGKFDPSHTAIPYDVWIQALGQLVDQLLTEIEMLAEVWKLRILNAVGDYGQLLIDMVPRLELLIGKQPQIQPLPPVESQSRFHLLLIRFMQLFFNREQPLVLFLDDLQWADEASLQFLDYLLTDRETKNLLVVGAYRDEELAFSAPFRRFKKQREVQALNEDNIHLSTLDHADLKQLLSDAMRSESADIHAFAAILLHKTGGNPFFVKQFIQELLERKLVVFNDQARCWEWDLRQIAEMNIPDNAAAYMSNRLEHLPPKMAHVLGRAACIGNRFELRILSVITEMSEPDILEALDAAVRERFLQQVVGSGTEYAFQHDRIQLTAYELVSESERMKLHLQIGRLLADRLSADNEMNVFEVVNQLNPAVEFITLSDQKLKLAELNLQAGMKAKQATAYETALGYFRYATMLLDLLDDDCWVNHYTLAFRAHIERAESEFLCLNFELANELFTLLLKQAAADLDKALVYMIKIQLESNKDNHEEVVALGCQALKLLGVRYDSQPHSFALVRHWLRVLWKLRKYPRGSLQNLPPMIDEHRKAAMSILVYICNSSFVLDKNGWMGSVFTMLEMTLDYGIAPESSTAYADYAMFLYYRFHSDRAVYEWGSLAFNVSKPYPALHVRALTVFSLCYDSWRRYEPALLGKFADDAGKVGLESGNLWQGNQSVIITCAMMLQFGQPLGDIYRRLITHSSDLQRNKNNLHWKEAAVFADLLSRLIGRRSPDDPFSDTDLGMEGIMDSVHEDVFSLLQELSYVSQYLISYLFGEFHEAYEYLKKTASIIEMRNNSGFEHSAQFMFESLVYAELYAEGGGRERSLYIAVIRGHLNKLKGYAKRCPENYRHKYLLIKAELARLASDDREAEHLYEQSIADARLYGHCHNWGIAAERFAKYGLNKGKLHLAKIYMTEAYEAYLQWGAQAKADDLAARYGHLLHIRKESGLDQIDYLSVVMSTRALSGEIEMPSLLNTLMQIMLQNAGAEFGALIFEYEGRWVIEAHGTADDLCIRPIPLEESTGFIPSAIIAYAAKTKEEVVLSDASREGMFARNAYVKDKQLKSVMCLPILHQDKMVCLLYMENKLSPGLFTPERLGMLKLLCSQCAISIDNAKLYSGIQYLKTSLEQQVEERTRSLERSMRETAATLAEMSVFEERNRIAQEIHDIVGHTLTSTILQVEAGKRLLNKDRQGAVERLEEAQDLVRHGLNEIRRSVHMLKEGQSFDLEHNLRQLIQDTERNMEVAVKALIRELPELPIAHKKVIYHALQEGLTNGIRHGRCTEFRFTLEYDGSYLLYKLEDNGSGAETIEMGFGLKAMKERVEQLGGNLRACSNPQKGFLLRIEIPHPMQQSGGGLR